MSLNLGGGQYEKNNFFKASLYKFQKKNQQSFFTKNNVKMCLNSTLLVGWLVGWMVGWLVGWMVGWSVRKLAMRQRALTRSLHNHIHNITSGHSQKIAIKCLINVYNILDSPLIEGGGRG